MEGERWGQAVGADPHHHCCCCPESEALSVCVCVCGGGGGVLHEHKCMLESSNNLPVVSAFFGI